MPSRTRRRAFQLYRKNVPGRLDPALFRNPTAEYRGAPFWSWNAKLDLPQLLRQIDQLKAMGFGGFHIHSRTGLADEYLGKEYMAAVVACSGKAAREGMLNWLYDEDRWPSGFAGGIVTLDPQYRIKRLLWTRTPRTPRESGSTLLANYEIELKDGRLARYRRLKEASAASKGVVWHAYLETLEPSSWFNHQTYVDTLDRRPIERFIEVTHERFFAAIGEQFGTVVPAVFTDEPQFTKKTHFSRADDDRDLVLAWTTDFADTYRKSYRQDLLDHLPELFWNLPNDAPSLARYRYHDHTAERFASAFSDTIGAWCETHGIALTGHMLGEATLFSQTRGGGGESMRGLRSFQLPGIDILSDRIELMTAKQAQSIAHQFNRPGVLSELYGVTGWDFDFVGHKAQGDWQAALGVTVRVPHLAWQSMAGEAKRDYPASIGYQSPWYREYPLIEDHFARVATVMTRGKPATRVAVIHPIESYYLHFGPLEQNQPEMERQEEAFKSLPHWLLFGLIDFDYISESLLPTQRGAGRSIGAMKYDAILVPALRTIRSTTLKRLEQFKRAGGDVIFAGDVPSLVDAKPSAVATRLARRCSVIPFERRAIVAALSPHRDIEIRHADATPSDSILHQVRIDGKCKHIFFCNTDRERARHNTRITIPGKWDVTFLDTSTGDMRPLHARVEGDRTVIPWTFTPHGHLLITLEPGGKTRVPAPVETKWHEIARLDDPVPVTLSEPNVLLLDQPMWRLDGEDWRPREEILRIDDIARDRLKLPRRGAKMAQPWADRDPAPIVAQLQLKFIVESDIPIHAAQLALEDAASVQIQIDGKRIASEVAGWWVDEAIHTVRLPSLAPGRHEIVLTIPFTRKTNVEWCYLLGDFGVALAGRHAHLRPAVREVAFGDWTRQGLPFYAGNVSYRCTIHGDGQRTLLEVPQFKNPLLSVDLDGKRAGAGKIAFAPFQLDLGVLSAGKHELDITAYGNRANAFGPLHHTSDYLTWIGPDTWRSTGAAWSYEYHLKRMGILTAPMIKTSQDEQ